MTQRPTTRGLGTDAANEARPARATELERPEKKVEEPLGESGRIAGRLLIEPGLSSSLVVWAEPASSDPSAFHGRIQEDGSFALPRLAPGTYRVLAGLRHERNTAVSLEEVVVLRGNETVLPPIDLRGRVRTIELGVRGLGNRLPQGCYVRRRSPGGEAYEGRIQPVDRDWIAVTTLEPCLDLSIEAPGYLAEEFECVSSRIDVALQPAPTVLLTLEGGLPWPRSSLRLGALLEPGGSAAPIGVAPAPFDERGVVRVAVERTGTYDVRVFVWRTEESGQVVEVSNRIEARVDVAQLIDGQAFAVPLSMETLERIDRAASF